MREFNNLKMREWWMREVKNGKNRITKRSKEKVVNLLKDKKLYIREGRDII